MPNFPNPFVGNVERQLTREELIQGLRIDIAGELEAIFLYEAHALATDDPLVKKVLMDIRDEEKEHCGELYKLMKHLDPDLATLMMNGETEVKEMMEELGIEDEEAEEAPPSVGSLIED